MRFILIPAAVMLLCLHAAQRMAPAADPSQGSEIHSHETARDRLLTADERDDLSARVDHFRSLGLI